MKKPMSPIAFKRLQKQSGKTNLQLAALLHKSPQSISNYRTGYQAIVPHVAAAMKALVDKPKAKVFRRRGHKVAPISRQLVT